MMQCHEKLNIWKHSEIRNVLNVSHIFCTYINFHASKLHLTPDKSSSHDNFSVVRAITEDVLGGLHTRMSTLQNLRTQKRIPILFGEYQAYKANVLVSAALTLVILLFCILEYYRLDEI